MSSLGKDLATIRLYLKKTLEDLHRSTRIPIDTLKRIESGAIFEDPDENIVYVRSFVRTYARALRIDEAALTSALDRFLEGNYNGELLDLYEDIDRKTAPRPLSKSDETADDSPKSEAGSRETPEAESGRQVEPGRTEPGAGESSRKEPDTASGDDPVKRTESEADGGEKPGTAGSGGGPEKTTEPIQQKGEPAGKTAPDAGTEPKEPGSQSGTAAGGKPTAGRPDMQKPQSSESAPGGRDQSGGKEAGETAGGEAPDKKTAQGKPGSATGQGEREVDWARMGHRMHRQPKKSPVRIIGIIITLLILLVGLYIIFWTDIIPDEFGLNRQDAIEAPANSPGPELILNLDEEGRQTGRTGDTGAPALDQTLYLTVYAAASRLDPVRVWSDLKPRMDPYWVEHGAAYTFEFQDTIRVRGQYSNMLLFFNGHRIDNVRQNHFNEEENSIELTRSHFRSEPRWAVPSGSLDLPAGVAPPDTIRHRPIFN